MKRIISRAVLLFLVFSLALGAAPSALASAGGFALSSAPNYTAAMDYALVYGTNKVNVRSGPGTTYEWIGAVDAGNWVGVTGEYANWYSVYVPKINLYGYMSKNYLKLSEPSSAAPASSIGYVMNPKPTQFLNLRAYPSYDAQVLGIFYNGAPFTLLSAGSDGWYQVLINNQMGYFRKEFVTISSGAVQSGDTYYVQSPNAGGVNLRNAPFVSGSEVIGAYPTGTMVSLVLSSPLKGSYWKVSVNGITGYMDSTYLVRSPQTAFPTGPSYAPGYNPPSYNPPAYNTQGYAIVNNPKANQHLNLRSQPSTSSRVIAQYTNGIRFEVLEPGETWTKVYGKASGNVGYMMTKYLLLYGVSASPQKTVSNGNSYVNLRSAPSKATGRVYVQVPSGVQVTILTPGDEWCQVRYGSVVGYMMTNFLR